MSAWGGPRSERLLGPPSAGQVCNSVGGAPGGPVSPLPGWLPADDRSWTRPLVFGVAGSGPCAGMRCQGVARVECPPPPYSWGWARLRALQVTTGAPGCLLSRGVVVGVAVPPFSTPVLVGGSVARRPLMVPERP